MTIENRVTKMRMLASEIGGEHHTPKEAEKLLNELADELSETNIQMSIKLHKCLEEIDNDYSDIDDCARFLYLRQKNIKELTDGKA